MRKAELTAIAAAVFAFFAFSAAAQDVKTGVGAGVGGAAGAAVGSALGGKTGAVVGGAVGGATGAAVTTNQNEGRTGAIVGGAVGGGAGAAVGHSMGGTTGAAVGAGVGGAAGAVVGRNISANQNSPQSTSSAVRAPVQPVTTVAVTGPGVGMRVVDDSCAGSKSKHKNHPGKGWAKGHSKKGC
jgi:hypothetical protein